MGKPKIVPGAAAWEASILPLGYAAPPPPPSNLISFHIYGAISAPERRLGIVGLYLLVPLPVEPTLDVLLDHDSAITKSFWPKLFKISHLTWEAITTFVTKILLDNIKAHIIFCDNYKLLSKELCHPWNCNEDQIWPKWCLKPIKFGTTLVWRARSIDCST